LIGLKFISKTLSRSDNLALLSEYLLVIAELDRCTILEGGAELATSPPIVSRLLIPKFLFLFFNLTPVSEN